jgi:hypothetical protein
MAGQRATEGTFGAADPEVLLGQRFRVQCNCLQPKVLAGEHRLVCQCVSVCVDLLHLTSAHTAVSLMLWDTGFNGNNLKLFPFRFSGRAVLTHASGRR